MCYESEKLKKLVESYCDDLTEKTREILRMPSVLNEPCDAAPFGADIAAALERTLDLGRDMGFLTANLDGYAGTIDLLPEGYTGTMEDAVGILCHIDVVPAGAGWQHPPFAAIVEDGRIYARGAVDDKGPLMASLFAMKAVKELGLPVSRPVRNIIGTDEETHCRCVRHYLNKLPQPAFGFTPDADFPVVFAEKGIAHMNCAIELPESGTDDLKLLSVCGGIRINMVAGEAETVLSATAAGYASVEAVLKSFVRRESITVEYQKDSDVLTVHAAGQPAHASTPHLGVNAIEILFDFLLTLPLGGLNAPLDALYRAVLSDYFGEGLGVACEDEDSGKLTLSADMINFVKNDTNSRIVISLDMRYPVTRDFAEIWEQLEKSCSSYGMTAELLEDNKPLYVPKNSHLVKTLSDVYREVTGDNSPPLAVGGGTYSRVFNNFVAFGPKFPHQEQLAHQADEYISIDDLLLMTVIYAEAIWRLAK